MTHGEKIKLAILNEGCKMWADDVSKLSARAIGIRLKLTHSAVLYHFGNFEKMKFAIAEHAVKNDLRSVVRQLEAVDHPALKKV